MKALDEADFERAESLLSPDCRYDFRGSLTVGSAPIVASYRGADEWAKSTFDHVGYESQLLECSGDTIPCDGAPYQARVQFVDHLIQAGDPHTHRCEQLLTISSGGSIVSIHHVDLPGERERVEAYNERHGIRRSTSEDSSGTNLD